MVISNISWSDKNDNHFLEIKGGDSHEVRNNNDWHKFLGSRRLKN